MNYDHLERLLKNHSRKTSYSSNIKIAFNVISLLSAIIYSWVTMENRVSDLEEKILKMEEMDKLETQIRMLELRGNDIELDNLRKRVN
jgi:hypothetical protein|tara:strand:- start:6199 stop:6462 length:264 start_codon:yes stop_codon:yes gene_type:complete